MAAKTLTWTMSHAGKYFRLGRHASDGGLKESRGLGLEVLRNFPSMGVFPRTLSGGNCPKRCYRVMAIILDCFGSGLRGLLGWQSLAICLAAGYVCGLPVGVNK